MPLLVLFLFGLIEVGWAHTQNLDVRHGAREGARLAAVNFDGTNTTGAAQLQAVVDETCDRLDDTEATAISLTYETLGANSLGDTAIIRVSRQHDQLTGVFTGFVNLNLTSEVEFRLEQDATWDAGTVNCI